VGPQRLENQGILWTQYYADADETDLGELLLIEFLWIQTCPKCSSRDLHSEDASDGEGMPTCLFLPFFFLMYTLDVPAVASSLG